MLLFVFMKDQKHDACHNSDEYGKGKARDQTQKTQYACTGQEINSFHGCKYNKTRCFFQPTTAQLLRNRGEFPCEICVGYAIIKSPQ